MSGSFFLEMRDTTPTRVWVNNPTWAEVSLALEQGAVGCTTNPAFAGNLLRRAPDEIRPIVAECVGLSVDDQVVANLVQQRLVSRILEKFLPVWEESGGKEGWVSIQGPPHLDTEALDIEAISRRNREAGPNAILKIPATRPGLDAFEVLVAEDFPTVVTEVFSLAQFAEANERYLRATERSGTRPAFFVAPITGIFGDYLKLVSGEAAQPIPAEEVELVGVILGRACYRMARERGYPALLLCGGARSAYDLLGFVGDSVHATVNWSTFAQILEAGPAKPSDVAPAPVAIAAEHLIASFEDVARALRVDGLSVDDFEAFGPVQHFRNAFVAGWDQLTAAIEEERARTASLALTDSHK